MLLFPFKLKETLPPSTTPQGSFLYSEGNGLPGAVFRNTARCEDKCFYLEGNASSLHTNNDSVRMKASTWMAVIQTLRKHGQVLWMFESVLVQPGNPHGMRSLALPCLGKGSSRSPATLVTSDAYSYCLLSTHCVSTFMSFSFTITWGPRNCLPH